MKPYFFGLLTAGSLLLAHPGRAQATAGRAEQEVAQLVRDFRTAEQNYDPTALARLTDARYVEVSPRGEVDERARFLGFYQPAQRKPWPPLAVSDEQIRVFGTTALDILTFTYSLPGPDGNTRSQAVRATFVAQREPQGWRLLGAQYTGVVPATPSAAPAR